MRVFVSAYIGGYQTMFMYVSLFATAHILILGWTKEKYEDRIMYKYT